MVNIKRIEKEDFIYKDWEEDSLDKINENFTNLNNSLENINPDLFAKLNSENIFTKDQTIKHDWVSLNLDSSSHSSLRYKLNWIDIFALSVWSEKDFKISRFVDWNWVWNVLVVNNSNWNIQIDWIINLLKDKYLIWRNQNNTESFAIWTNNHWGFFNVRNNQWRESIKIEWGEVKILGNDWTANLIIDNNQNSVIRFRKNWKDVFTNAIVGNNNFVISRFVDWNWVNDAFTIRNDNWWIILWNIPTSPAGLSTWGVWREGNTLKIVP